MNKLKSRAGETLVELLLSMLIISLGMMMLAGAIVTTARLNKSAKDLVEDNRSPALTSFVPYPFQVTPATGGTAIINTQIPLKGESEMYYDG